MCGKIYHRNDLKASPMKRPVPAPDLLTVAEVAVMAGCSTPTVYTRVKNGALPSPIKVGGATRWRRRDILAALDGRRA